MATPAQIANDMDAQAKWWAKQRGKLRIAATCADSAKAIRILLAGERLDGRFWHGLHLRLVSLEHHDTLRVARTDLTRARLCLEELRRQA